MGCSLPFDVIMKGQWRVHSRKHRFRLLFEFQNPMGKDQSCGESLFKCFKGGMALIGEMPGVPLR